MSYPTEVKHLRSATREDVETLYQQQEQQLHEKIDATRDAYFGFIFPINRADLVAVSDALELDQRVAEFIYKNGKDFSTFIIPGKNYGQLTNHIYGATILALREKSLDTGLENINDENIERFSRENDDVILEIAAARASWFGKIYFPAQAFANAISVFGGKVSADAVFRLAEAYGYASVAGKRNTVRGDFGIALWLTLLGRA